LPRKTSKISKAARELTGAAASDANIQIAEEE
jgi:hypothetical protein